MFGVIATQLIAFKNSCCKELHCNNLVAIVGRTWSGQKLPEGMTFLANTKQDPLVRIHFVTHNEMENYQTFGSGLNLEMNHSFRNHYILPICTGVNIFSYSRRVLDVHVFVLNSDSLAKNIFHVCICTCYKRTSAKSVSCVDLIQIRWCSVMFHVCVSPLSVSDLFSLVSTTHI